MSKWYEVKMTIVKVFAIEVSDDEGEEEAYNVATGECSDADEMEATMISDPNMIDSVRRHADEVFSLEQSK
jgi:hypothetical protein